MSWPSAGDYDDAVQSPSTCFDDPELKRGVAATNTMGLPRVASGNFASVYEITTADQRWAIRCYTRQPPKRQEEHYAALTQHLAALRLPMLAEFHHMQRGIRIRGTWYPAVKMEWIEGTPLNNFVEQQVKHDASALVRLAESWRKVASDLSHHRIAHGDLQHGNILITKQGSFRLVDYDAMFVPALAGRECPELGHNHFQHPEREAKHYDERLDHFSSLVIYTSLRALAADKGLWSSANGDSLIFQAPDYKNPLNSKVFRRLRNNQQAEVRSLGLALEGYCNVRPEAVPPLEQILTSLSHGSPQTSLGATSSTKTPDWARPEPATGRRKAPKKTREPKSPPPPQPTQPPLPLPAPPPAWWRGPAGRCVIPISVCCALAAIVYCEPNYQAQTKVQAEAKAKAEFEFKSKAEAKTQAEAKAKSENKLMAEAKAKAEFEFKSKAEVAEAKLKAENEAKEKMAAEKAEAEAEAKRMAKEKRLADAKAKLEADTKARATALATATKLRLWTNSLGMPFATVAGTPVFFSVWDTRVQDYQTFASATKRSWPKPSFQQEPTHPAVNVSWNDAQAFCKWLTERGRRAGEIPAGVIYRLPQDWEWSVAVGLNEPKAGSPKVKDAAINGVYPWSGQYPPPRGVGNYAASVNVDDFANTSPVGSFTANAFGLYDMGGNVWQWCEDLYTPTSTARVLRGGSWGNYYSNTLLSSYRADNAPGDRYDYIGFRVVLVDGATR